MIRFLDPQALFVCFSDSDSTREPGAMTVRGRPLVNERLASRQRPGQRVVESDRASKGPVRDRGDPLLNTRFCNYRLWYISDMLLSRLRKVKKAQPAVRHTQSAAMDPSGQLVRGFPYIQAAHADA